ncbi:galectin-3-binding protein B-like [Mytilus galloprovincialis]|uniref:galectin-3-binding protein B-like n=1 Tax=Mytilus galloprovincialis TaxID=29158 RepID=UPI003F7C0182
MKPLNEQNAIFFYNRYVNDIYYCRAEVDCTSTDSKRLVNGSYPDEGRLEIYHNGVWGTVCDDDFDCAAAMVVCRQLGYRTGFSLGNSVTDGQGKIWLDSIHCNGSESKITSCQHQSWGSHDCVHSEDVGVHCFSSYRLNYQYELYFNLQHCNETSWDKNHCDSSCCAGRYCVLAEIGHNQTEQGIQH